MADFSEFLEVAQKYKVQVDKLDQETQAKVVKIYQDVLKDFLRYVSARVRKNPASTVDKVLKRPDVLYNFQSFWDEAQKKVQAEIKDVYVKAAQIGAEQAMEEAQLLGLKVDPHEMPETPYLKSLQKDIDKQMDDMEEAFVEAIRSSFGRGDVVAADKRRSREERKEFADQVASRMSERIARAVASMSHRAKMSASVAAQRGMSDGHMLTYKKADLPDAVWKKVWLANFTNNSPCPTCTALHGIVVDLDDEFPAPAGSGLAVYGDLSGPPRHPNCKCRLVIFPEIGGAVAFTTDKASPDKLKSYAKKRTKEIPKSKRESLGISSQEIKAMPATKFVKWKNKIVSSIKTWWEKKRGKD